MCASTATATPAYFTLSPATYAHTCSGASVAHSTIALPLRCLLPDASVPEAAAICLLPITDAPVPVPACMKTRSACSGGCGDKGKLEQSEQPDTLEKEDEGGEKGDLHLKAHCLPRARASKANLQARQLRRGL